MSMGNNSDGTCHYGVSDLSEYLLETMTAAAEQSEDVAAER